MKKQENFEFSSVALTPSGPVVPDIMDRKTNKEYVNWGEDNKLPDYLWDNYLKCSNLQAIVNTVVDYVCGDRIVIGNFPYENIEDDIRNAAFDYVLFGGFAFECIRNRVGDIVRVNHIGVSHIRVDEELTTAFIAPRWNQYSSKDITKLPLYNPKEKQDHFVLYFRGNITRGINPVPCYISALKSIEILNNTRNFHLRNLENGFTSSVVISLNNGIIKQRELEKIKEDLEANYTGSSNAGKVIIVNAQDKEHAPTIERLQADNFGDLYKSLSESSVNDIFIAFRINPVLLGTNVSGGFNPVEYQNIFEMYNRTFVRPMQHSIAKVLEKIGIDVKFEKFKIDWVE